MRFRTAALAAIIVALSSPGTLLAQSTQSSQQSTSVPRLINISGTFRPADGQKPGRVEVVTLAIYGDETGGEPLWQETQSVTVDQLGNYSLLLGATQGDGVPLEVFASGQARWLGIVWARPGEVEARTPLTSVPYALRAADAATLGGKPASAYVLAPTSGEGTISTATAQEGIGTEAVLPGTTNFLAKYVNGADVGNSAVYESGGYVGINTTAPLDVLHARFTNTDGGLTGIAVQNLGSSATSYSGMLFYDQNGALGQFQGFNNSTHEYRINNIASGGSINFMLGGVSRFKVDPTLGVGIAAPVGILAGGATIGLSVFSSGSQGIGVQNTNASGTAIYATGSSTAYGVFASTDTGSAIVGIPTDTVVGWAGTFAGDAQVIGTLYKGGGAFRIDHPLDPENKYLSHSFVESPDMKNIYDGVAVLDGSGEATITLPEWFEALNESFRYQLTPMGAAFVPYVAEEIAGNQFKIAGGIPGKKVSWQVTGIRHDAFANTNRIQVEELKSDGAAGTYLHPEAFGLPAEKGRSKSAAKDPETPEELMKARLRAINQKPGKR